jgi:iron complex outermembrane receptor protein
MRAPWMRGLGVRVVSALLAACVAVGVAVGPADAQAATPLDQRVSLRLSGISLRDAIDRIAAAAHIRISYASDLIPLDRAVRSAPEHATVGGVLSAILTGVPVRPVAAGPDQVVLAPEAPAARTTPAIDAPQFALATASLERVVVTGSTAGREERALTIGLSVIDGRDLSATGTHDLASALTAAAPGIWMWPQSPASLVTRFGSVRGASSFGANYPKVYVDGIAVANPLLVSEFDPDRVQRIEVIRGPQGAALYGADAISGVINIVTRHDGASDGARFRARTAAGVSSSDYVATTPLAQEHRFAADFGTSQRSAQLSAGITSLGAFYPGANSRTVQADGAARWIGASSILTGTARYYDGRVGAADNPLLGGTTAGSGAPQTLREFTLGGTLKASGAGRWSHTVVAGLDGYELKNVANEGTPFPSSADSALRAARGAAVRTTLRGASVAQFGSDAGFGGTLTLAAEHSALRQVTPVVDLAREREPDAYQPATGNARWQMGGMGPQARANAAVTEWLSDASVLSQADLGWHDAYFLTAGVRLERNDGYLTTARVNALPSLGAAWVTDVGGATLKVRAAYGRGTRAPKSPVRETVFGGFRSAGTTLDVGPEEQSGVEAGVDLAFGRAFTLQLTRFDQTASGLIQQVVRPDSASAAQPGGPPQRLTLEYQNVGSITNRGWEAQGTYRRGRLALSGAWATVDSRVRTIAPTYGGDLRPGDRMLDVPEHTLSAVAAWTTARWTGSLTLARAFDWVDYDRVSLAQAYAEFDRGAAPLWGADLRGYWRLYRGNTDVSANFAFRLGRGLSLTLSGDNLLDHQRGAPDNATILPGRTITTGLRIGWP